jgi:catechol 2,3-dioxygenase-like lactoylglutathione lyase family enzyme
MEMRLRCELFTADLDQEVDFYTRVLRFRVTNRRNGGRRSASS